MSFLDRLRNWLVPTPKEKEAEPTVADSLTITRVLDATPQKVWMMWTTPEHFIEWFGVPPIVPTLETTRLDVRVGGSWQADMVNAIDGTRTPFRGTYTEIDPQKKLVFTIVNPEKPESPDVETVIVTMKDVSGRTQMSLHQSGHLPKEQYGAPLLHAYTAFFDRMSHHLMLLR
jgi:uncharacterized protein YndB with AHSA1/START domain